MRTVPVSMKIIKHCQMKMDIIVLYFIAVFFHMDIVIPKINLLVSVVFAFVKDFFY